MDELLAVWTAQNTKPFEAVLGSNADRPLLQYRRFAEIWLDPKGFDPKLDAAVREWGRSDRRVSGLMREADAFRTKLLGSIFLALGCDAIEAEVRARITYYHQVGYYVLDLKESQAERLRLFPHYHRILTGSDPAPN